MLLPFTFLKFWFLEAPVEMIRFFASLNSYFMELFALPLCLRTFFKPLKNEYREGLIAFSRAMGIIVKSVLIFVDLLILISLLLIEIVIVLFFLAFPIITVALIIF